MQNRYVGDVADFAKHGLLRFLSGTTDTARPDPRLRLGVLWYMHHDEKHARGNNTRISGDGGHIEYLARTPDDDRRNYRECDPDLWEKLRDLVFRDARCVHCAEGADILPPATQYFNALLDFPPYMSHQHAAKRARRNAWMDAALEYTRDADLVCCDPDNGIGDTAEMYRKDGPKHTYADDLRAFWGRGQSLVVYHHTGRTNGGARDVMIPQGADRIREALGVEPISLWFHRGSARAYYVVPQPCHEDALRDRTAQLLASPWGRNGHFEQVP